MTEKEIQDLELTHQQEGYFEMNEYYSFSKLFTYPNNNFFKEIEEIEKHVNSADIRFIDKFSFVKEHFINLTISEFQEYYIRTFDVNASCYLDIGYVLFGEDSKRAQFLLNMQTEQLKVNNDCGSEFADHLPNVLTLLDKIKGTDLREELVVVMLIPALEHMLNNFRSEENIYKFLLEILLEFLMKEYPNSEYLPYSIIQDSKELGNAYSCGIEFIKSKIN
jgi:nitrate reductase assembly molybdenum cofactor insertion protein NarJ